MKVITNLCSYLACSGGPEARCNCGVVPDTMTKETAMLTDNNYLPVMALHFEDAASSGQTLEHSLGQLQLLLDLRSCLKFIIALPYIPPSSGNLLGTSNAAWTQRMRWSHYFHYTDCMPRCHSYKPHIATPHGEKQSPRQ